MIETVAGIEALVILILLCALILGQPASVEQDRVQLAAAQTQIARPATPGPTPTKTCPGFTRC